MKLKAAPGWKVTERNDPEMRGTVVETIDGHEPADGELVCTDEETGQLYQYRHFDALQVKKRIRGAPPMEVDANA